MNMNRVPSRPATVDWWCASRDSLVRRAVDLATTSNNRQSRQLQLVARFLQSPEAAPARRLAGRRVGP